MEVTVSLKDRVLELVAAEPGLTDRELADRLLGHGAPQQSVNQAANGLAGAKRLLRRRRADGLIGNYPLIAAQGVDLGSERPARQRTADGIAEDDVKRSLQSWLELNGWVVKVVWGRDRGIDIEARRGDSRWIIEAKGQGTLSAMRVNFFLGALGELLQRMDDPEARYSIALPDLGQYRGLWQRLPPLAKERIRASALFVTASGQVDEVH